MPTDPTCIFCRIAKGEIPAEIVYRDEFCVAFLDVNPLAPGHLLVIPVDHYALVTQAPPAVIGALASVVPRLGAALMQTASAPAFNLLQNNGSDAGQVVQHVHFHLIPRRSGDGLGYRWNAGAYPQGAAREMGDSYRRFLQAGC
ncbi:MAG: HIT family protein [Phycisphaerales bacterium]|nr:HIT family protein [Phycisphaerales bacterium]